MDDLFEMFENKMKEAGKGKAQTDAFLNVKVKNAAGEWKSLRGIPLSNKRKTDRNLLVQLKKDADTMAKLVAADRIAFTLYEAGDESVTEDEFAVDEEEIQ